MSLMLTGMHKRLYKLHLLDIFNSISLDNGDIHVIAWHECFKLALKYVSRNGCVFHNAALRNTIYCYI